MVCLNMEITVSLWATTQSLADRSRLHIGFASQQDGAGVAQGTWETNALGSEMSAARLGLLEATC
jgi:hypothetical protein